MYVIAVCKGIKTLQIASALFKDHDIGCWVPRLVNNKPKKGEKRIRAALPGFLFIPVESYDKADGLQRKRVVPEFRPLNINGKHHACTYRELKDFESAIEGLNTPQVYVGKSIEVGDTVEVIHGPFKGLKGKVEALKIQDQVLVTLSSGGCPNISMPASFIG